MSFMPAVHASLAERFFFNFRLPAKAVARSLPVSWLAPQEVRGYGVASFCILDLRGITVAPLTTQIGLTSRVRIGTQLIFEQGGIDNRIISSASMPKLSCGGLVPTKSRRVQFDCSSGRISLSPVRASLPSAFCAR